MAKCVNHQQKEALTNCHICQKPICQDCIGEKDDERTLCFSCAISAAANKFQKEKEEQDIITQKEEKVLQRKKQQARIRRFLSIAGIIFLIEFSIIATNYFVGGKYTPVEQLMTKEMLIRKELDDCCYQMYKVTLALESYAKDHQGRYPDTLKSINPSYLKEPPICPVSQKPYLYRPAEDNKSFLLNCPRPEEHKIEKLTFSNQGGPYLEEK